MAYLVKQSTAAGIKAHVVNKGFACKPSELLQELATELQIAKQSIIHIGHYQADVAEIIAASLNNEVQT